MQVTPERLREVVAGHLDVDADRLVDGASLADDLFLDSLSATELLVVVEDAFELRLPEDLYDGVDTYGAFAAAVQRNAVA